MGEYASNLKQNSATKQIVVKSSKLEIKLLEIMPNRLNNKKLIKIIKSIII